MKRIPISIIVLAMTAVAVTPTASWSVMPMSDSPDTCTQNGPDGDGAIDISSADCPPDFFTCIGGLRYNYTYICVSDGAGLPMECKEYHQGNVWNDPECL